METQSTGLRTVLPLGAFTVDDMGRIGLQDGRVGGFGFRWRGRPMLLELDQGKDAGVMAGATACRITLSARIGRIPSTALSPERRPDAFALLRAMPLLLPDGWRLSLLSDHGLRLHAETTLALPAMIGALIEPATRFALQMAPYLDVLEQYGVAMNA